MSASESPSEVLMRAAGKLRGQAEATEALTVPPGFAREAAGWLESAARDAAYARERDGEWDLRYCDDPEGIRRALRAARAILGEAAPRD